MQQQKGIESPQIFEPPCYPSTPIEVKGRLTGMNMAFNNSKQVIALKKGLKQ